MNRELAEELSPELQSALQPLLDEIESLSERIREYNERVQQIARENYPEVARLEQVKGVGTLIALSYVLTLEDPQQRRRSLSKWVLSKRDRNCARDATKATPDTNKKPQVVVSGGSPGPVQPPGGGLVAGRRHAV
jgi:hypothetical protein